MSKRLTQETARKGIPVRKVTRAGYSSRSWEGVTCSEPYGEIPNCPRHQIRIDVELRPRVVEKGVLLSLLEPISPTEQEQEAA